MFTVSKKIEYSIALVSHLANNPGKTVSLALMAKKLLLPYRFLGQLTLLLKSAGVVEGREGRTGGYVLGRGWEKRSIYDLLESLGENKHMVECLEERSKCNRRVECRLYRVWGRIERKMVEELKSIKLSEVRL